MLCAAQQLQTPAGLGGGKEHEASLKTFLRGYEIFCLSPDGIQNTSSLHEVWLLCVWS